MGEQVIEKHFTYDKEAEGPDHMLSATKEEMKLLVDKVRLFEKMKGNGIKKPVGDENKNRINNRKSIVTTREIKAGEILTAENIDIKRPGKGISPKFWENIVGKVATRDLEGDTLLQWSDF